MESGYENAEARSELIKQKVFAVADALRDANLLIPQTYTSIRVFGALAIIEALDEIEADELAEGNGQYFDEIVDELVGTMNAAHAPFGVIPKEEGVPLTGDNVHERVASLYRHHFKTAVTATADIIGFVEAVEGEGSTPEQNADIAKTYLRTLQTILKDGSLRQELVAYRRAVAKERDVKFPEAAVLQSRIKELFLEKVQADAFFAEHKLDSELLFAKITDPSRRLLSDE